jgi:hypothetical protein
MAGDGVKAAMANTSATSEHKAMEPMVPKSLMLMAALSVRKQGDGAWKWGTSARDELPIEGDEYVRREAALYSACSAGKLSRSKLL